MKPPFVVPLGRSEAPQRKRRPAAADGTGFARHLSGTSANPTPAAVTETTETLPLEALLALQAVTGDGGDADRQAGQRRGASLLDLLDRLRADLLEGRVAHTHLLQLAGLVRERRGTSSDARLEQIIDEIELRAEVELAKLTLRR